MAPFASNLLVHHIKFLVVDSSLNLLYFIYTFLALWDFRIIFHQILIPQAANATEPTSLTKFQYSQFRNACLILAGPLGIVSTI